MKRIWRVICALGCFLAAQAWGQWQPAKRLSWNSGESKSPVLAVDSNHTIHVVWEDDTPGKSEIYYKRSIDGGATWSASRRLTWTSGNSYRPAVALDSANQVHIVWESETPGNREISYKKSTDGGATWTAAKRLTWTSGESDSPAIAADSDNHITVVWSEYPHDNAEIFYRRSLDGGTTWGTLNRLTWTSNDSFDPLIAADMTDKIHIIWDEGYYSSGPGLFYVSSVDGTTYGDPMPLSGDSGDVTFPALAVSGNMVCVVWQIGSYDPSGFYYRISMDRGENWSAIMELPTYSLDDFYNPAIAFSGKSINVVWQDYSPGYPKIYYMRSKYGGIFWNPPVRLTWNFGDSCSPSIAVDSANGVHVVWYDNTPGNYEVYYKKRN